MCNGEGRKQEEEEDDDEEEGHEGEEEDEEEEGDEGEEGDEKENENRVYWFHRECVGMSSEAYAKLQDDPNIRWYCPGCVANINLSKKKREKAKKERKRKNGILVVSFIQIYCKSCLSRGGHT